MTTEQAVATRSADEVIEHMRAACHANATDPEASENERNAWAGHVELLDELKAALKPSLVEPSSGEREIFCYIGWPKDKPRFHLDIVYAGTTRIEDEYDYQPLYTRAQDAAGKGVGDVQMIEMQRKARVWIKDCPNDVRCYVTMLEFRLAELAAKPAQVGQKYRDPTIDDAREARRVFLETNEGQPACDMLTALNSIGAVVLAQDGAK